MGETEISWTHQPGTVGRTWSPVQGCLRVSEGCRNCYAERLAARFAESGWSRGLINLKTRKWNGEARLAAHKLSEPLSWRKPSTVFVNSMSDLFYEGFTNEQIAAVFGVMAAAQQHTFQILTKRARRMREWFEWVEQQRKVDGDPWVTCLRESISSADDAATIDKLSNCRLNIGGFIVPGSWPLPNVWLGVSVENQEAADERIPELLETPAAVRFLSCEPLLGPLDLSRWVGGNDVRQDQESRGVRLRGGDGGRVGDPSERRDLASGEADGRWPGRGSFSGVHADTSRSDRNDGLSDSASDDRRQAHDGPVASSGVAAFQRTDSRWSDGEPQERGQARQPARQPRAGDGLRAAAPRDARAEEGTCRTPVRHAEPCSEADRGAGHRDSRGSADGNAAAHDRGEVRDHVPARLGDRTRQDSIGWIICGCESGPRARPCDVAWLRSLRDQCDAAGVPFFLKQAIELRGTDDQSGDSHRIAMHKGSKRKAGNVIELPALDGEQFAQFPEVARG